MKFHKGTFLKRYKRFFADIKSSEDKLLTLHCPNTGAMTGLLQEGVEALYSVATPEEMKTRKTPGTLEALRVYVDSDKSYYWVGVNTHRANQIAQNWLESKAVKSKFQVLEVIREVRLQRLYNEALQANVDNVFTDRALQTDSVLQNVQMKTRVDFMLKRQGKPPLLVEVKSATLYENGQGFFPDAVSVRAAQQLQDLLLMKKLGHDILILYVSQHQAIQSVEPAAHIDSQYAELVSKAKEDGVFVKTLEFDATFYGID